MAELLTYFQFTDQSQDTYEIPDAIKITVDRGSEIKNNSLRIKLKNNPAGVLSDGNIRNYWVDTDGVIKFRAVKATAGEVIDEELIDIYAHYTTTDPTISVNNNDYLIMTGVINSGKIYSKENNNYIELKCVDRNYIAMNKLSIPQAFDPADSWTSPTIIQHLVRHSAENSDDNAIAFNSTGVSGRNSSGSEYIYLIDARLFSEGIKSSGTATSASTNKLVDSSGTFVTDSVAKGDWVRNSTSNPNSYAYVVSVDSETQLTLSKDIFTLGTESYQVSNGFIQDTRPDGTAFPAKAFSQINKPLTEGIEKLSQIDFTNSASELNDSTGALIVKRSGRWFIDNKNRLHWYIPDDTPEYIMRVGQTVAISPDTANHKIIDAELTNEIVNEVNFIIFKAGEDMDNVQITSYSYQPFTGRPNPKEAERNYENIAVGMKLLDYQAGNITHLGGTQFDYPGGYPVTPAWDSQERSVGTDNDYNDNFKEEAIKRGKARAQAEFLKRSNPRWGGKVQLRGENINVGDLIKFTSIPHGVKNKLMRVNQVTHTINPTEGWFTVLEVLEDEKERQIS